MATADQQMVVTDLDGTLLDDARRCPDANLAALTDLARRGICRAVATGRSLYSANRVLPPDFPIDYLIFSSGAGIIEYASRALIFSASLTADEIRRSAAALQAQGLDFAVQAPVPDSHVHSSFASASPHPDFEHRCEIYREFRSPAPGLPETACQLIAITDQRPGLVEAIRAALPGLNVVRTTSPLDHRSLWIEIFPGNVSKAAAAQELCTRLGVPGQRTLAVGNDYNDLALLDWAGLAAVVGNSPEELRHRYHAVADNNAGGFAEAVRYGISNSIC